MKKTIYTLFLATLVISSIEAQAWSTYGHKVIVATASTFINPSARIEAEKILGGSISDYTMSVDDNKVRFTVNADLKSVTTDEKDAIVRIEKAAEIVKNRTKYDAATVRKALMELIHIVPDINSIGHVTIEGIPQSYKSFPMVISNGYFDAKKVEEKTTWKRFWDGALVGRHSIFSPEYYAEDINIMYNDKYDEIVAGTPRDWAYDMAREAKAAYAWGKPNYFMTRQQNNELEPICHRCLARAAYRLAAILNDCLK